MYSTICVCTCRIFVALHIVISLQVYEMYIRVYATGANGYAKRTHSSIKDNLVHSG